MYATSDRQTDGRTDDGRRSPLNAPAPLRGGGIIIERTRRKGVQLKLKSPNKRQATCMNVRTKTNYFNEIVANILAIFSQDSQFHALSGDINRFVKHSAVCARITRVTDGQTNSSAAPSVRSVIIKISRPYCSHIRLVCGHVRTVPNFQRGIK